jgi:hypothetical protein
MWFSLMNDATRNRINGKSESFSWLPTVFFFLLFSGPPRFRYRDPTASLGNEIDWAITAQIIVWICAGIWLAIFFWSRSRRKSLTWGTPEKIAIVFVGLVCLSVFGSVAPALTAFKAFQMLVGMLFAFVFVQQYGVERCLRALLWSSVLLCIVLAVCAVVAPDLVYDVSETGALRLRGELIADTGVVSMLGFTLLIGWRHRLWKPIFWIGVSLCFSLLVLSLARWAYIAALGTIVLVILKRTRHGVSWLTAGSFSCFAIFMAYGGPNKFADFRDPESIWTLSDRLGLWAYLSTITLTRAPWTGLGYYAASRMYGPEYNPGLGTAHSMFVEAFVGAGLPALLVLIILCIVLFVYAVKILLRPQSNRSVVVPALFFSVLLGGVVGAPLESGPLAISFWSVLSILSYERIKMERASRG